MLRTFTILYAVCLFRDDDDINDVAAMGGVNLSEESRNIMATNSDLMAGQLRSCKDESFLHSPALQARISAICKFIFALH